MADRLGIPPSQLDGREPTETTEYEYDGDRLVRAVTTREPLWTERDRAELLALAEYRSRLCPSCGGLLSECTSHEADGPRFRASYVLCRSRNALAITQAAKKSEIDHPEAAIWSVTTLPPTRR